MMDERLYWFRFAFRLRSSVIPSIAPRVILCAGLALVVSWFSTRGYNLSLPIDNIVPSLVLGLLLVFRTNTAYERFWEGRKQWGNISNTARNFARQMWVAIAEEERSDRQQKIQALRLLVAFAVAVKRHLRHEPMTAELDTLMPEAWYTKLQGMTNPPLEVAFWLGDYLQTQHDRGRVGAYQLAAMFKHLDTMVEALGACERILKTPIPLAYSIHLKQLLLLYCLGLPFQLVGNSGWWTALIVAIISFTVFGIEAIGIEIENPFGYDANDLPLDQICQNMRLIIEDLVSLEPGVQHWHDPEMTGAASLSGELLPLPDDPAMPQ